MEGRSLLCCGGLGEREREACVRACVRVCARASLCTFTFCTLWFYRVKEEDKAVELKCHSVLNTRESYL